MSPQVLNGIMRGRFVSQLSEGPETGYDHPIVRSWDSRMKAVMCVSVAVETQYIPDTRRGWRRTESIKEADFGEVQHW